MEGSEESNSSFEVSLTGPAGGNVRKEGLRDDSVSGFQQLSVKSGCLPT